MRDVFDDDFSRKIEVFKKAVVENTENPALKALGNQIHVQVMPTPDRVGFLLKTPESEVLGTKNNGYGTVLNIGPEVTQVAVGDDVLFPKKLGRKFGGMYNPLQVGKDTDWFDELRILSEREVIATMDYELQGEQIQFEAVGGEVMTGVVEEESALYAQLLKVRVEGDDEPYWVPYKNVLQ